MDSFLLRLQNSREKTGYNKKDVSLKLGFTENVYGAYERGDRRPTIETLIEISDLFDVSLDYLLKGREYSKNKTEEEATLEEVLLHFKELGIHKPYILEINKWKSLSREDIEELSNHFNWVVEKAKSQKRT